MVRLRILVASLFIVMVTPLQAEDATSLKIDAAERYMRVANLGAIWESMVSEHAATLPEPERTEYLQSPQSKINIEKFEAILLDGLIEVFTAEELNALADFYGSEAGQSALAKFGKFSAYINPRIENIVVEEIHDDQR